MRLWSGKMVDKLKRYYQRKWRLSERLALKAAEIMWNYDGSIFCKCWRMLRYGTLGFFGVFVELWENYYRKRRLMSILKCDEKAVAIDINELLKKKNTIYIGDDYTYNAMTDLKYLKNVKLIFGNADFRALKNLSHLKNLRFVMGDLFLSSMERLEKLKYVGGTIYYQNQQFDTLKEFVLWKNMREDCVGERDTNISVC